ncbi:MAG: rod shape-determining protein MreD [Vicinamibacterales bacterium]
MKFTSVLLTVIVGVLLQITFARFTVGGRWVFDLVLVAVVYAGLNWGPLAGIMAGTMGGLLQDLLSGQIVGVGGLSKTLVGFGAGAIGTQFVLTRPHGRTLVLAVASLAHRLLMLVLYGMIDQHWPGLSWTAMLTETGLNCLCGLLLFQGSVALPDAFNRQRVNRRSSLSRRQW